MESDPGLRNAFRYARRFGYLGFGLQFILLSVRSRHIYDTFGLSADFSITYNGWIQIAHGNLNPFNTHTNHYFLQNHFELLTIPLGLFGLITKSGYFLLELQNVGVAGAGLVAYLWANDHCAKRLTSTASKKLFIIAALVVVTLMVINPWIYLTAATNFHLEPLAALFTLLCAWSFYKGQDKRAIAFLILTLLNGDVGATYLVPAGISLYLMRRDRWWPSVVMMTAGVAWLGAISASGFNVGSALGSYTWILGDNVRVREGKPSLPLILFGIIFHPLRVLQAFWDRAGDIYDKLAPTGGVGLFTPLALPLSLVILIENTLNSNSHYWEPTFQDLPLVVIAGAGLLTMVWRVGTMASKWRLLAYPLLAIVGLNAVWFDTHRTQTLQPIHHATVAAKPLNVVYSQLKYTDEVVGSFDIIGRFAGREQYWILDQLPLTIPVKSSRVIFVFDLRENRQDNLLKGNMPVAIDYVRNTLHAKQLVDSNQIVAFAWTPSPETKIIEFPASR